MSDLDSKERPKDWSRYSNAPYYKDKFARTLFTFLLTHLVNPETKEFKTDEDLFVSWPSRECRTKKSLKLLIDQAWMYAIDFLDTPDFLMKRLRKEIRICSENDGIYLRWKINFQNRYDGVSIEATPVKAGQGNSTVKWRSELEDFLINTDEPNTVFKKQKITLDQEQVTFVRNLVEGAEGFHIVKLDVNSIIILYNPKLAEMQKILSSPS